MKEIWTDFSFPGRLPHLGESPDSLIPAALCSFKLSTVSQSHFLFLNIEYRSFKFAGSIVIFAIYIHSFVIIPPFNHFTITHSPFGLGLSLLFCIIVHIQPCIRLFLAPILKYGKLSNDRVADGLEFGSSTRTSTTRLVWGPSLVFARLFFMLHFFSYAAFLHLSPPCHYMSWCSFSSHSPALNHIPSRFSISR